MKTIIFDPRKEFDKKYNAMRKKATRKGATAYDESRFWILDMIGDPRNLPSEYRKLFIRPKGGLEGVEEYGPVDLKYRDRFNLAMFCLVNGLSLVNICEFMRLHGAYDGKPKRNDELTTTFANLRNGPNKKYSAFSVGDQCYMTLDGEPDPKKNKLIKPVAYTFPDGEKTHYREHVTAGSAMGSYEPPPWKPLLKT